MDFHKLCLFALSLLNIDSSHFGEEGFHIYGESALQQARALLLCYIILEIARTSARGKYRGTI